MDDAPKKRYRDQIFIILFLAISIIGIYMTLSYRSPSKNENECVPTNNEWVTVALNGRHFRVREAWGTWVTRFDEQGDRIHVEFRNCERQIPLSQEVDSFWFAPKIMRAFYSNHARSRGFSVRVGATNHSSSLFSTEDTNCRNVDQFVEYRPANHRKVFRTYCGTIRQQTVMISCRIVSSREELCSSYFKWEDHINFGFRELSTLHVPREQWVEFYDAFLQYMENLEVSK